MALRIWSHSAWSFASTCGVGAPTRGSRTGLGEETDNIVIGNEKDESDQKQKSQTIRCQLKRPVNTPTTHRFRPLMVDGYSSDSWKRRVVGVITRRLRGA